MQAALVQVALVQADCSSDEGFDARIDRVLAETDRACQQADLVVLPELWSTAAFDLDWPANTPNHSIAHGLTHGGHREEEQRVVARWFDPEVTDDGRH